MKIGNWIFFKHQIIQNSDGVYLKRWIIFRCDSFSFMLHKFERSDYDRSLHDHPWPFVSLILRGGYLEEYWNEKSGKKEWFTNKPGSFLIRPAIWRHRVVLNEDKKTKKIIPAWTLIITGKWERDWGFWLSDGWCWWRKHNPELNICENHIVDNSE